MGSSGRSETRAGEQGFVLLGLIVAIFLILLVLSVAAPRVARSLRRDQELESQHRAQQYTRAIRNYYGKTGHYPTSIDQLEKTNNIRFLRQKYADPLTGKPDWRLIHQGEAKTTVKGLFGQPLAGLAAGNLGSAAGNQSAGGVGNSVASGGFSSASPATPGAGGLGGSSTGGTGLGSGAGSSGFGSTGSNGGGFGSSTGSSSFGSAANATVDSSTSGSSLGGGVSSQSASSFSGGGPIMGIGSSATGEAMLVVNEQTTYPTWEFLYDPRIEQLSKGVNLFGGGVASTGAGSLGSASGLNSGFGGSPSTTNGGTGSGAGSGFGTGGFGNSNGAQGSGNGSTNGTPAPAGPPPTSP